MRESQRQRERQRGGKAGRVSQGPLSVCLGHWWWFLEGQKIQTECSIRHCPALPSCLPVSCPSLSPPTFQCQYLWNRILGGCHYYYYYYYYFKKALPAQCRKVENYQKLGNGWRSQQSLKSDSPEKTAAEICSISYQICRSFKFKRVANIVKLFASWWGLEKP